MSETAEPALTGTKGWLRCGAAMLLVVVCWTGSLAWAAPSEACTIPRSLGVAFSIDDSGSMADSDPDRLRSAATGAGIDQLPDGATTAVSSFDTGARSLVDPTVVTSANRPTIKNDVDSSLVAAGQTYYDLAFAKAKEQLDNMPGTDKRGLVFLSDGAPNGGDYENELDAIRLAGIPVFAIGFFSAPGSVLAEIAASTGGQAYTVQSPGEAQAVFARIVSTLTCDAQQVQESVTLAPGQTRAFPYTIGASDREFRALAAWYDGAVGVRLRRPDGSFLEHGAERTGERFIADDTYASVIGTNPPTGGWELQVTARADNIDDVDVTIDIFRRTSADPPDAFPLVSPAAGVELQRVPTRFVWEGARNAQSYELEIDDQIVVRGLSREQTFADYTVAGPAVPRSWRVAAVNQFGRTLSERRPFTLAPRVPVVLVAGLAETNPEVLRSAACAGLTDFATICSALHNVGHPVYVMKSSKGGSGDRELDNGGSVRPNAQKLAAFIKKEVTPRNSDRPPLVIGHSMGGLIARTAISDFKVRSAGLFTIGTPHSGSFGADLAVGAAVAPCLPFDHGCRAIKTAAELVMADKGRNAVVDLTAASRLLANVSLREAPADTWILAGYPCQVPLIFDSYWSPNDGIVGKASAHGRLANLGDVMKLEANLWHTMNGPLACDLFGQNRPNNQFTDQFVIDEVTKAAATVDKPAGRAMLRSVGAASPAAASAAVRPRVSKVTFNLAAARGRKLRRRTAAPLAPKTTLVAGRKPFAATCAGKRVEAVPLFGSGVYALDPSLLNCAQPKLVAPIAMGVLVARNSARVRATLTIRGTRLTLSLRASRPVRRAKLRAGTRRVKTSSRRVGGRLILSAPVPARSRGRLQIEVVVAGTRYSAVVPRR